MAENDTLLAHLVPKHHRSTEYAATDALVYILNKSNSARSAFNAWIKTVVAGVEDCTAFRTQETEGDSQFDLVGYDKDGKRSVRRVIGESKFWAGLSVGQGSGYLKQLADTGPAVLLFIVPEARINYLWPEVVKDVERGCEGVEGREVTPCDAAPSGIKKAVATGTAKYLVMVSWRTLLSEILNNSAADSGVRSDIQQLQGLTDRMDLDAFLPLRKEELGPDFPRRMMNLVRLVNEALNEGVRQGWVFPLESRWSGSTDLESAGWYLRISDRRVASWFGIYHKLWARGASEDTPLWLRLYWVSPDILGKISAELESRVSEENYFPIHLKTGVEYDDVLGDVVRQLRAIADVIRANTPPAQPD